MLDQIEKLIEEIHKKRKGQELDIGMEMMTSPEKRSEFKELLLELDVFSEPMWNFISEVRYEEMLEK